MPIKRLFVLSALTAALFTSGPLFATSAASLVSSQASTLQVFSQAGVFNPATSLAQSILIKTSQPGAAAPSSLKSGALTAASQSSLAQTSDDASDDDADISAVSGINDLRKTLIGLAMNLRNIRYVRGGHDPSTGFDCSGFVKYVFAHAVGISLPPNSASQFVAGLTVSRSQMKPGDLVFFRTAGRRGRGRISHVGIYVANGQFIHSPSAGKTVRVDSLDEAYWAKRFAGAKRPEAIAQNG